MDTKSKNSKLTYKIICFILAVLFAALSGIFTLSAVNTGILYDSSNQKMTGTLPFIFAFTEDVERLKSTVVPYENRYKSYADFNAHSEEAQKVRSSFAEKEKAALEIYAIITELKKRCPGNIDDYPGFLEENGYEYSDSHDEYSIKFGGDISEFTGDTDMSQYIDDTYTDYGKWASDYSALRNIIFSIVNDARNEKAIKDEIASECREEISERYHNYEWRLSDAEKTVSAFINFVFLYTDKNGNTLTNIDESRITEEEFINTLSDDSLFCVKYENGELMSPGVSYNQDNDFLNFLTADLLSDFRTVSADNFRDGFNGSLYIKISSEPVKGDVYYLINENYKAASGSASLNTALAVIFLILSLVSAAVLLFLSGKTPGGRVKLNPLEKIPFIVQLALYLSCLCLCLTGYVLLFVPFSFSYELAGSGFAFIISPAVIKACIGTVSALSMLLTVLFLIYIARNIAAEKFGKRFLTGLVFAFICFIFRKIRNAFAGLKRKLANVKSVKQTTILLVLGYFAVTALFALMLFISSFTESIFFIICAVLYGMFNIGVLVFVLRYVSDIVRLAEYAEKIKSGDLDTDINVNSFVIPLRKFADDLNNCRDSIKNAVEKAVRGERFKTELITNVSHDLKTPLTSIINYVSLLKLENTTEEDKKEYLDILEQKSKKLQRLIEDLTEASKANSGNMKVVLETAGLNELALQAVGENSDALEEAGLDLIYNEPEEKISILCNPQKTSRIIDNLFSNAKKYSLSGTRVYAGIHSENGYGVFTLKNISREKLNISPEELTERFVRGDKSRTTEGSGLGLSIARSFTEIQNGRFSIEIDGDMFKASVYLPLSEKTE